MTTADATFALNNRQLEYGLEPEERNRILSDFVSSNYGMHQREIFAAIGIYGIYYIQGAARKSEHFKTA